MIASSEGCGHGRSGGCHECGVAVVVEDPKEDSRYKSGVSWEGCGRGSYRPCHKGVVAVVVEGLEEVSRYKACSDGVWGRVWTWEVVVKMAWLWW